MRSQPGLHPTLWRTSRVIANHRRLAAFRLVLAHPDLGVSDAARGLRLSIAAVSQCLRALEARSLLEARRTAGRVYYRVPALDPAIPAHAVVAALRAGFRSRSGFAATAFRLATAFTHPRCIAIFRLLRQATLSEGQVRRAVGISRSASKRHLGKLRRRGFVVLREGRYRPGRLRGALAKALARMADGVG